MSFAISLQELPKYFLCLTKGSHTVGKVKKVKHFCMFLK